MISSLKLLKTPEDLFSPKMSISFSTSLFFNSANSFSYSESRVSITGLSCAFDFLSFIARENNFLSTTTPLKEGPAFKDASFTSPALSPKIARSSFSSGEGSVSPLGVILPMRMSPSLISAPMRINPFSSRSLVASSLTLGMSEVNSSIPRLVSLTSKEYSSI